MPLTYYRCSKCRREFGTYAEAENCESAHLTVVEAHVAGYGIHPYPYEITVTFSNGKSQIYIAQNQH